MKSWEQNWDVLSPMFKFSSEVRKVIYTTNAIESLNSSYKRLNSQRYLATLQATKKWTLPLRN